MRTVPLLFALLALATLPGVARAQQDAAAAPDSNAARGGPPVPRASWISDRVPLRVGDLLTVVVDEQTAARERVSRVAVGNRSQRNSLSADMNDDNQAYRFNFGMDTDSRDVGEANRAGDLTAVLSVRVVQIEENGIAHIEGKKSVTVDGRAQEIALKGVVRPQDVSRSNTVLSSHVAEAVITYKGKKIGPRTGIIGKILGMLWP
jgi:flagellar L-ring protein FlgH